jgi:hypothetical protein
MRLMFYLLPLIAIIYVLFNLSLIPISSVWLLMIPILGFGFFYALDIHHDRHISEILGLLIGGAVFVFLFPTVLSQMNSVLIIPNNSTTVMTTTSNTS